MRRQPLGLVLALLISCAVARAEDDWQGELFSAAPAAWPALLDKYAEHLNYGVVKGLARAAESRAADERSLTALALAEAIAARLKEPRSDAYVAMMRGHVLAARGDWPAAAKAFQEGADRWAAQSWEEGELDCRAWLAVAALHTKDPRAAELFRQVVVGRPPASGLLAAPDRLAAATGWACYLRGWLEDALQRWSVAETWYLQAVTQYERLHAARPLAYALDRAGIVSYYQSKLDAAQGLYRRCLAAATEAKDLREVGRAHLGFAEILTDRARFDEVLKELELALSSLAKTDSPLDTARCYWLRAMAQQQRGRHDLVEAELQQAERWYRQGQSQGGLADCNQVRGVNYLLLGDRARAMKAFDDAAQVYADTGNRLGEANIRLKQAHACRVVGQTERARKLAAEALEAYRVLGERPGSENALRTLGELAQGEAKLDEAEQHYREALAVAQAIGDKLGEAGIRWRLGGLLLQRNPDSDPAIELLLGAMELSETIGDQHGAALPAIDLGVVVARKGDAVLARKAFLKALTLGEASGSRTIMASALYHLGLLAESLDPPNLKGAAELYRMALEIVEQLRARAGEQEAQQGTQQAYLSYYQALTRVYLKLGQPAQALRVAEEAHARTLLDILTDAGVDPDLTLPTTERQAESALAGRVTAANVSLGRLLARADAPAQAVDQLRGELTSAREELGQYRARLVTAHPELERRRGAPLDPAALGKLLPPDTALIEYELGAAGSFAFVITTGGGVQVKGHELPVSAAKAADLAEAFRAGCASPRRRWRNAGREAAEALLNPLLGDLGPGIKRLVIVPDQALYELPFQALPLNDKEVLWDRYVLSTACSASLLSVLRNEPPTAARGLVAFADPKFGALVRSPDLAAGAPLADLPGTAEEARGIAREFGADAAVYTREQASEENAKQQIGRYRYVHFATHGLLDSASPLYSAVALAEPAAGSHEDGVLEAREILDLKLSADLVTLSACETGLGKVQPGEGLLGLAWAVTAAGARTVVVSQWQVSDESTRDLMVGFYHRLRDQEDKAAALRNAALAVRATKEHPYWWAPFVILGSW